MQTISRTEHVSCKGVLNKMCNRTLILKIIKKRLILQEKICGKWAWKMEYSHDILKKTEEVIYIINLGEWIADQGKDVRLKRCL